MFNLALIDTKTHEIKVFAGSKKNLLSVATFNIALTPEQVESMRSDPQKYLESIGANWENLPPLSA